MNHNMIFLCLYIVQPCMVQIGSYVMVRCTAVCFCFTLHGLSGFTSPHFHRTTFQVIGSSYLALRSSEAGPPECTPVPVSLNSSNIPHINLDRSLSQWRAPSAHNPIIHHPLRRSNPLLPALLLGFWPLICLVKAVFS